MIIDEGSLKVQWFDEKYAGQLVALHRACFPKEDWQAEDFQRFIDKPGKNNVLKVVTDDRGRVYASLLYTLSAYECVIRRVGVIESHRRVGLATFAINSLVSPRSPIKRKVFSAAVRCNNKPAVALMTSLRFNRGPRRFNAQDEDYVLFTFLKPQRTEELSLHNQAQ